jgi:hypothetical protein
MAQEAPARTKIPATGARRGRTILAIYHRIGAPEAQRIETVLLA